MKKKKYNRVVNQATAHISTSFNNTCVTISDPQGNVLAWSSSGSCGFKGSRKSTPFAAQKVVQKALNNVEGYGVNSIDIQIQGPGPARDSAIRAFGTQGMKVTSIRDVTPIPHNGVRPPKKRRV